MGKRKRAVSQNREKNRERSLANLKPFQPGQSGNPGGRPKKTPYADAHRQIAETALKDIAIKPGDTVAVAQAKKLALQGAKGDVRSAQECANRTEGRVAENISLGNADGQPLQIVVRNIGRPRESKPA
jgi:hypothetical protein